VAISAAKLWLKRKSCLQRRKLSGMAMAGVSACNHSAIWHGSYLAAWRSNISENENNQKAAVGGESGVASAYRRQQ